MKKITFLLIFVCSFSFAQVGIGTTNPTGALDVSSTLPSPSLNKAGFVPPTVALSATNSIVTTTPTVSVVNPATNLAPVDGTIVYNTNLSAAGPNQVTPGYYFYNAGIWEKLTSGANTNWSLSGNASTTPGTNYIGTSDSQALVVKTNNTERMRYLSDGRISVNNATPSTTDRFSSYNTTTSDNAIAGYSTLTGRGMYAENTGTGRAIYSLNSGTGTGVYAENSGASGSAIYATNSNTSSSAATIRALSSGSGSALRAVASGTSWGVYSDYSGTDAMAPSIIGFTSGVTLSGTGFLPTNCSASVYGEAASAGNYKFGVYGNGGTSRRSGGVMGSSSGNSFGALGYQANNGNYYSFYGFNIPVQTGGAGGRISNSALAPNSNIGIGIYGGVMGGWIKGEKYGFHAKGDDYSLYVDGNSFVNKPIALLTQNESGNNRSVTYMSTSLSPEISCKGKSKLTNGKIFVSFDNNFGSLIQNTDDLVINVTPRGNSKGLYVTDVTKNGFWIYENNNGNSNVDLFWSATCELKSSRNNEISKDILSNDFDEKMNKLMSNDADVNSKSQPLWWDGSKIRWDEPKLERKTESKERIKDEK